MNKQVQFGLLSFAHHHANHWAKAINSIDQAELVGIWDDDVQRGREAANRHTSSHFEDLEKLLSRCDAVGITAETTKHADLIRRVAEAGVHILCEKPMAAEPEGCERIIRAVQDAGVIYMQNFPKRFDPINRELYEILRDGSLGEIMLVRVRHSNFHFLEEDGREWFIDPSLSGGGILLDEGIHAADLLLWLFGEPERVVAATSDNVLDLGVDDTAVAIFSYPTGVLAELSTGGGLLAADSTVEVHGTDGSVTVSATDLTSSDFAVAPYLKIYRKGSPRGEWEPSRTVPRFKSDDFHGEGPLHFVECLLTGKEPVTGLQEGAEAVSVISATYEAAKTGQAQTIQYPVMESSQLARET